MSASKPIRHAGEGEWPEVIRGLLAASRHDELPDDVTFISESAASGLVLSWLFTVVLAPIFLLAIVVTSREWWVQWQNRGADASVPEQTAGFLVGLLLAVLCLVLLVAWCARATHRHRLIRSGRWMCGIYLASDYLVFRYRKKANIYPRESIARVAQETVHYRNRHADGLFPAVVVGSGKKKEKHIETGSWCRPTPEIVEELKRWLKD